ncbi:triose-phosphate isomerase [Neobacillus vireti]|uniref:Triosephosphate isomerase n=1 Tax=Neobacillus vireti LMG 21834 TaxID=1131730 RepID=A0AB94IPG0_9BACI|nr:triose-phosphate isomerase [Neobacillus vireti]ETI68892.1 triosephosphate isomerase [Neobacillus vireti LMG 21834]
MEQSIESYIKNLVRDVIGQTLGGLQIQGDRQTYVIANWKMNKTLAETAEFFQEINSSNDVTVVVCPPAQLLYPAHLFIKQSGKPVHLGGQNVHWADNGAYTGETSTEMLKDVGCEYVIIGHSERRQYAGEDDSLVNMKVKQSIMAGLTPIICIGETLEQKNALQTEVVLAKQLFGALNKIDSSHFIIAYEPVWAIGTGQSATAELAQQTHAYIRSVLKQILGEKAESVSILYGGSANESNAAEYSRMPDIDGLLVGGASLKAKSFDGMIKVFAKGEQNS